MEPIESSETSAYINTLTPGTYPKEKKLHVFSSLLAIIIQSQQKHFDTVALHVKEIILKAAYSLKVYIRTLLKGLQCSVASVASTSPVLVSAMLLLLLNMNGLP